MSDVEIDFDADELAMLRQLFRSEAQDALEAVTARLLASGSAKPSPETLTEMMRVTHTLKGAAGTVGLPAMADLSHRLESALAELGGEFSAWGVETADRLVEVIDGLREYLDHPTDPNADAVTAELRTQIDRIVRPIRRAESQPPVWGMGPGDFVADASATDASPLRGVPDSVEPPPKLGLDHACEPAEPAAEPAAEPGPPPEPKGWLHV